MAPTEGEKKALSLKDEGTALFKKDHFFDALKLYKEALKHATGDDTKVALLKNCAACQLKLEKYKGAVSSCDKALAIVPNDVKALYRRSQAHEALGDLKGAFKDMATASRFDPKNKAARREANRLMQIVGQEMKTKQSSKGISDDMVAKVLSGKDLPTKRQALKNCVVLAREDHGARHLIEMEAHTRFLPLLSGDDVDLRVHTLFLFSAIAENSPSRATAIVTTFVSSAKSEIARFAESDEIREVKALVRVFSLSLQALSDAQETVDANEAVVMECLKQLVAIIKNRKQSLPGRAAAIAGVMHSIKNADVAKRFVALGGVRAMLVTAALSPSPLLERTQRAEAKRKVDSRDGTAAADGKDSSGELVSVRSVVSLCMQRIHEATKAKGLPSEELVADCMSQVQFSDEYQANIPSVKALIAIMAASVDIGNMIMEQKDVFSHLMTLAKSDDAEAQCVAAEAISYAASDKKRARGIMLEGAPILKQLYMKDKDDIIRVRALCGLCKMAAVGSGAKNLRSMTEDSMINLAKKLRPFLVDQGHDEDTRKWASEGLAFLSLDADVKEYIIEDTAILKAVHSVCMGEDPMLQFSLANMLVNLTNSFDKPEKSAEHEELKKLGKYAGENLPEPHELDATEYVLKRVDKLVKQNYVTALVALGKSESEAAKEQVARVLHAFTEDQQHRGVVVAQGGAKTLLALTRSNTEKGVIKAAHALAKIAITTNPEVAFPGQRSLELIKPLVALSKQMNGLMMFEAAMALTNLAGMNDTVRMKMLKEKAVLRLEDMMFDDDPMIRRAATEALCNCFYCEDIFKEFATKDGKSFERLKLWILFAGVEQEEFDLATCRAASGGLALLSASPDVCEKIVEEKQGLQILKELIVCGEEALQHRGLHIIRNMVTNGSKETAEKLTEKEMLVILTALNVTSKNPVITEYTDDILKQFVALGFMASVDQLKRSAAESARDIQIMREKSKEEAKARIAEAESDGDDDNDDEEDDEDEEGEKEVIVLEDLKKQTASGNNSNSGSTDDNARAKASAGEDSDELVAPEALEELDGPKFEVIE